MTVLKKTLWAALGIALPLVILALIKHQTGMPPPLPFGWFAVWFGAFVALILAVRIMDLMLKGVFARRPEAERFATGILIGCWIFTGIYLHN